MGKKQMIYHQHIPQLFPSLQNHPVTEIRSTWNPTPGVLLQEKEGIGSGALDTIITPWEQRNPGHHPALPPLLLPQLSQRDQIGCRVGGSTSGFSGPT